MNQELAGSTEALPGTAADPLHMPDGETDASLSGAVWRRSTASTANGNCVEVAFLLGQVAVRDSKDRTGPVLRLSHDQWQGLLDAIRENRFTRSL
jgi:hypothetical protein